MPQLLTKYNMYMAHIHYDNIKKKHFYVVTMRRRLCSTFCVMIQIFIFL